QANSGRISSRGAPDDQPPLSGTSPAAPGRIAAARQAPTRAVANMQPGIRPRAIDLIAHPAPEQVFVSQAPALTPLIPQQSAQRKVQPISHACAGLTESTTIIPDCPERRECLGKQLAREPGPARHGARSRRPARRRGRSFGIPGRSWVGAFGRRNVEDTRGSTPYAIRAPAVS